MQSNIDPRSRNSAEAVSHNAFYQPSAHVPNLDHSSQQKCGTIISLPLLSIENHLYAVLLQPTNNLIIINSM